MTLYACGTFPAGERVVAVLVRHGLEERAVAADVGENEGAGGRRG